MNIHLLTEVSTYVESGGVAEDLALTAPAGQARFQTLLQIDTVDPATGAIGPPTNPVLDGDFIAMRTRFGEFLDVPSGGTALRSRASLFVPSVPGSIFRIRTINGEVGGPIAHGDRIAIRRVDRVPPFGPVFAAVDTDAWLTVNRTPPHAITFRTFTPLEELSAAEGFRFLIPVDARSFTFANDRLTIPYAGDAIAVATLAGTGAGLPGGTLVDIALGGDTDFAASSVLQATLPEGAESVPVAIRIIGHHGKLDGCTTRQLFFRAGAAATGTSMQGHTLTLDEGHIPFMRMKERASRWATPENQGCLGRLLPGFLTPNDLMVEAELLLQRHASLADSDLPVVNVTFASEDPAIAVFPAASTLTYETPIVFAFAVQSPRRQPEHCGNIHVRFELAGGAKPMEARFAVLFRAGTIALDPFWAR